MDMSNANGNKTAIDMSKANRNKIDFDNLDLNRSYSLEEFEFINDQLKTRTLEIDGQPVNLFELDKKGRLIPIPQTPYSRREKVVAEIVGQLRNWNIQNHLNGGVTSSQRGFNFDVGEIDRQLDARQNWTFKGDSFTPLLVVEVENISTLTKFNEIDKKFKDVYFAEGTSVQVGWLIDPENKIIHVYRRGQRRWNRGWKDVDGGKFLPRFTLKVRKIEHAISKQELVQPKPHKPVSFHCSSCSKTFTDSYTAIQHIEDDHIFMN
ncbi:hypothetical protein Glove_166g220 [Diversispora epigaea]|uniref:C2H2-type domain-containing protein n=1 Tax=Diversispora epigaea TaxID=1348612 RepID=A0A397IZ00_9GLOM|nr:hypothetical protein Glove_166g220 [Diversispora epigaea]